MPDKAYGALAPPLYLSTTFERSADGSYPLGFEYARDDNPNRHDFEHAISEMEAGVDAAAFASGSAAIMTLFQALRPGDRVIVSHDCYYGVRQMLERVFVPWGLRVDLVDTTQLSALERALENPAKIIFVETPSNPLIRISDLTQITQLAHSHGALVVCDNTIATPELQRPFEHGVDVVVHSTTKYCSGHHDAMGGVLVAREHSAYWESIRFLQRLCGCVPSPFAAWLTSRDLTTLSLRVRAQGDTAFRLAQFLEAHPGIERVHHPSLPAHPDYEVARRQLRGPVALFSIQVRGGREEAMRVAANARVFKRATSFGGVESLIEHRASIEGPRSTTPPNLLRIAVGLEPFDALKADLDRSLVAPAE
ncbi:MAG TPA: aminotransferase class I/II-fold pyridoxal phosphate-dependent enzyme [Candidatus Baltobacteraceae bacterium]|nr:aminotransferase class I/II-fold pyridoxal phosphate-dependent enzyme [Candidatus Baltobacteraceae bacterium]